SHHHSMLPQLQQPQQQMGRFFPPSRPASHLVVVMDSQQNTHRQASTQFSSNSQCPESQQRTNGAQSNALLVTGQQQFQSRNNLRSIQPLQQQTSSNSSLQMHVDSMPTRFRRLEKDSDSEEDDRFDSDSEEDDGCSTGDIVSTNLFTNSPQQ